MTAAANCTNTIDPNFKITEIMISGFSSGAFTTANLLRIEPEAFDGAAILSGSMFPGFFNTTRVPPNGTLTGKPLYYYHGLKDQILPHANVLETLEYLKPSNANIKTNFIPGFNHVLGSQLPEVE